MWTCKGGNKRGEKIEKGSQDLRYKIEMGVRKSTKKSHDAGRCGEWWEVWGEVLERTRPRREEKGQL